MPGETAIGWTDRSWNPVTGCHKVSPGCDHCYAEALSLRFGRSALPWTRPNAEQNVQLHPERLGIPLTWRKPCRIFVNSMSDLFHPLVPDGFIAWVWDVMARTPWHTYQILTKRPERMHDFVLRWSDLAGESRLPLPNVWLGTSVEDQRRADERIPWLVKTPAAVRFLSCEPLLGPLNLDRHIHGVEDFPGPIHWVIVGGESGAHFRPMDLDWARSIRDECQDAGIPFFFKQGSGRLPERNRELDGRTWDEMPATAQTVEAQ